LDRIGLRIHTYYHVLICVNCGFAWLPRKIKEHLKSHGIRLDSLQESELTIVIGDNYVLPIDDIQAPEPNGPPVECLKMYPDGYCCLHCSYCALSKLTFDKHWSQAHKALGFLPPEERSTIGTIQTFFRPQPQRFFRVNPNLDKVLPEDPFAIYMQTEVPHFAPFPATLPINPHEVPPFLQMTQWHIHLQDYTQEYRKRRWLRDLIALPRKISHRPTGLERLRGLSFDYLDKVRSIAKDSQISVLLLLQECPL
jgi:hypothetical protein